MQQDMQKIIEQLSPLERKVVLYLNLKNEEIKEKAGIDEASFLHALKFLENKGILKLEKTKKSIIELGTNGIYYKKNHLPERQLILLLEKNNYLGFEEAKKHSKLSDNEFKAAIGALKDKALLEIKNGKLILNASKEELAKKTFEEQLIDILPIEKEALKPEHKLALENLQNRKEIVGIKEQTITTFTLTEIGKELAGKEINLDLVEELTPEIIKTWNKKQKFRVYDIKAPVPQISGGKKHFVNQAIEYGRRIWLDLGFKEMTSTKAVTSFWNFDALFQPQDHPARFMHDTFFIKGKEGKLPDKKLVENVKKSHELGVDNSKGWQYLWNEKEAKKVLLRTHTTCLSAQTLAKLKPQDIPGKYFAIGKCFRNETLDWSHGFEFNQTEGIVIDENANLLNLLGYLKEFFLKMGFEDIKFIPSYFPYTEPSLEIYGFLKTKKIWIEIGGAGMLRPEVVIPLLGKYVPVLAWGPGFDRTLMDYYQIRDLRELYSNDIKQLREKRVWIK